MSLERINIDQITRTKSTLDGTERFVGRDDIGDFKALLSTIVSELLVPEPVGTVKPWAKSFPGVTALEAGFVECNGAVINDTSSLLNGYRAYNLNGDDVILTLTWTADVGGAYATVAATDITGIMEGDNVSGAGIAANSYISDITGTTVTITDVSASGSISTTFTNNGRFLRGGATSGVGQKDQMQKITGSLAEIATNFGVVRKSGSSLTGAFSIGSSTLTNTPAATATQGTSLEFDSADSPDARVSADTFGETRPENSSIVWIMKTR